MKVLVKEHILIFYFSFDTRCGFSAHQAYDESFGNKYILIYYFSFDIRSGLAAHQADDESFGNRAYFDISDQTPMLRIKNIKKTDGGKFVCRVDFRQEATEYTKLTLVVIGKIKIESNDLQTIAIYLKAQILFSFNFRFCLLKFKTL